MTELQRALIAKMLTLANWRAAEDAESQVAHWLMERQASLADLMEARTRTVEAHKQHAAASRTWSSPARDR
jgi:hypothetical protein